MRELESTLAVANRTSESEGFAEPAHSLRLQSEGHSSHSYAAHPWPIQILWLLAAAQSETQITASSSLSDTQAKSAD